VTVGALDDRSSAGAVQETRRSGRHTTQLDTQHAIRHVAANSSSTSRAISRLVFGMHGSVPWHETTSLPWFRYLALLDDATPSTKSSGGYPQCGQTRDEIHCPASSSSMPIPANRATRSARAGVTARLPVATFWEVARRG
jgi:hypothetical protein